MLCGRDGPRPAARPTLSDFTHLTDLAAERTGGEVLYANDDFFAPKENLIKPAKPVFLEEKYTDRGKWMDGWESRRRRTPGHDWCLLRLGLPGIVRGVVVDTSFFRGNYPAHCSIDACLAPPGASAEQLLSPETQWHELLPKSELAGDTLNRFTVSCPYRFTHLRLNIFPDGGVARLRVHGEVIPDWRRVLAAHDEVDLIAIEHGGQPLACSDMFYSHPLNLLMPGRGVRMDDGWETKRRRGPGHDWVTLRLGIAGAVKRIEVDTAHFKGNYPESCSIEGCAVADEAGLERATWQELLPRTKLEADKQHAFDRDLHGIGAITHARLNIYPDGGVSRLRLIGAPSREGRVAAGLRLLNALLPGEAEHALPNCCGSPRWAAAMCAARPFASVAELHAASQQAFASMEREDWLAAFAAHPRIGEKKSAAQSGAANAWSAGEQSGTRDAAAGTMQALAEANREYDARFGRTFIICATGKSAEEMLALLRIRLKNDPETEFRIAAEEQKKITALRLEKLITL